MNNVVTLIGELPTEKPEYFILTPNDIDFNTPLQRDIDRGFKPDLYNFSIKSSVDDTEPDRWWCKLTPTGKIKAKSCRKEPRNSGFHN